MIAGINKQGDLEIYIESNLVSFVDQATLDIAVVMTDNPKIRGLVSVSYNSASEDHSSFQLGRLEHLSNGFVLPLVLSQKQYRALTKENGSSFCYNETNGAKINLYSVSEKPSDEKNRADHLEAYVRYKDQIDSLPADYFSSPTKVMSDLEFQDFTRLMR